MAAIRSIPRCSTSNRRWAATLSRMVTSAGYPSLELALEDNPLENMSGMTMNHRPGSSTWSGPIMAASSVWVAP